MEKKTAASQNRYLRPHGIHFKKKRPKHNQKRGYESHRRQPGNLHWFHWVLCLHPHRLLVGHSNDWRVTPATCLKRDPSPNDSIQLVEPSPTISSFILLQSFEHTLIAFWLDNPPTSTGWDWPTGSVFPALWCGHSCYMQCRGSRERFENRG